MSTKLQIAQAGVNVELLRRLGNSPFAPKLKRGRPRLLGHGKMIERSIRLPVELDRNIGWLAKQAGQSKAGWIREVLFRAMGGPSCPSNNLKTLGS